jgi:hypothetical protein
LLNSDARLDFRVFTRGFHLYLVRHASSGANPVGLGCHKVAKKNVFAFTFLPMDAFHFLF